MQGPVEHIWIGEVSLGRTKSATKLVKGVAQAWSSYRPRLPLTVRGLRIELREGSAAPDWAAKAPAKEKKPPVKGATAQLPVLDAEEKGRSMSQALLMALAARAAFAALPGLPVRVKKLSLVHKVHCSFCAPAPYPDNTALHKLCRGWLADSVAAEASL
jgi:hypothetical protein